MAARTFAKAYVGDLVGQVFDGLTEVRFPPHRLMVMVLVLVLVVMLLLLLLLVVVLSAAAGGGGAGAD